MKFDLSSARKGVTGLTGAPCLPSVTLRLDELRTVAPQVIALDQFRVKARPTPAFLTESNSKLFTYAGPVLGARQLMIYQSTVRSEPLPPGFCETPPELLALLALNLSVMDCPTATMTHDAPLTPDARTAVECWEDAGLGIWATSAFYLSHVYLPTRTLWVPLTPAIERAAR